jgi:hypothetical protein
VVDLNTVTSLSGTYKLSNSRSGVTPSPQSIGGGMRGGDLARAECFDVTESKLRWFFEVGRKGADCLSMVEAAIGS